MDKFEYSDFSEKQMIKLLETLSLPKNITVAFSGGVDSTAAVDFLRHKHNVTCAFFNHGTEQDDQAESFVRQFCRIHRLSLVVEKIKTPKPSDLSPEEHWRNQRYAFLENLQGTVITAHHLDDCIETYIHSCLNGRPKVIPYRRNNIIRPFLLTRKQDFIDWCVRHGLTWFEDESNQDYKYKRNLIRKEIVPLAFQVNPGLDKVVRRFILKNFENQENFNKVHKTKQYTQHKKL